jgi:hypothetical protein
MRLGGSGEVDEIPEIQVEIRETPRDLGIVLDPIEFLRERIFVGTF